MSDAVEPLRIVRWAIREIGTGKYLLDYGHHSGHTWYEAAVPRNKLLPRLFLNPTNAKKALAHWLRGPLEKKVIDPEERRHPWAVGVVVASQFGRHRFEPRLREKMEIVQLTLTDQTIPA